MCRQYHLTSGRFQPAKIIFPDGSFTAASLQPSTITVCQLCYFMNYRNAAHWQIEVPMTAF